LRSALGGLAAWRAPPSGADARAIEPVGEAGTGREAVSQARELKPDVILMDVVMPDRTGLDVLPTLAREHPEAKVLLLSMLDDPRYVREALRPGRAATCSRRP
jgi:DNA-binding NarL/FixJ family response regulator